MTDYDDHHEERLAQFFLFTPDFTVDIFPDVPDKENQPPSIYAGFDFGERLTAVTELMLPFALPAGTILRFMARRREIPSK